MGYAKSLGRDPGEFVRFFMERQTDWEKLRGDLEGVFRAFVVNFQEHTICWTTSLTWWWARKA